MATSDGMGELLRINHLLNANQFRIFFYLCEYPHGDHEFKAPASFLTKNCKITEEVLEQEVNALRGWREVSVQYSRGWDEADVTWRLLK